MWNDLDELKRRAVTLVFILVFFLSILWGRTQSSYLVLVAGSLDPLFVDQAFRGIFFALGTIYFMQRKTAAVTDEVVKITKQELFFIIMSCTLLVASHFTRRLVDFDRAYITLIHAILIFAIHEWSRLLYQDLLKKILYAGFVLACYVVAIRYVVAQGASNIIDIMPLSVLSLSFWVLATVFLVVFNKLPLRLNRIIIFLVAPLCLIPTFLMVLSINSQTLFLVVLLVLATDSGAYVVGKTIGKHPLALHISPKKTLEGVIGGILLAMVFFVVYLKFCTDSNMVQKFHSPSVIVCFVLLISLSAVLGDLFESAIKRVAGVKDSGILLPGHGGILDRIDALLCSIPVFLILINLI